LDENAWIEPLGGTASSSGALSFSDCALFCAKGAVSSRKPLNFTAYALGGRLEFPNVFIPESK